MKPILRLLKDSTVDPTVEAERLEYLTRERGEARPNQGHRINRIQRDQAATADPKIRHQVYENGTCMDISRITDVDPVN